MSQSFDRSSGSDPDLLESSRITPDDLVPVAEYAERHQTAVLVVLFTDIKGSTQLTEIHGETFSRDLRHKHDAMLRKTFERDNSGRLIKTIGDSLMYVFAKPSDAVARSLEAQQQLHDYNANHPDEPALLVRIGMHMGQVLVEKDVDMDVFGRHVNRAARVESLADGGQILVSHSVYDSARGWISTDMASWHDHGEYLLKGIPESTRIVEVCPKGALPRRPSGTRVSTSRIWPWLVTAAVVLLGVVWMMSPTGVTEKLPLPMIEVKVRRGEAMIMSLKDATPVVTGDELRIRAAFPKPVYAAILQVDENGTAEIVKSSGNDRVSVLEFPEGAEHWVEVAGGKGAEMLIALESTKPITKPPDLFEKRKWKLPESGASDETLWISPTEIQTERQGQKIASRGLGSINKHETHDLHSLVDQLRQSLADQSYRFHAVVYPHESR